MSELSGILEDERDSGHGRAAILQEEQVLRISAEKQIESLKVDFFTLWTLCINCDWDHVPYETRIYALLLVTPRKQ